MRSPPPSAAAVATAVELAAPTAVLAAQLTSLTSLSSSDAWSSSAIDLSDWSSSENLYDSVTTSSYNSDKGGLDLREAAVDDFSDNASSPEHIYEAIPEPIEHYQWTTAWSDLGLASAWPQWLIAKDEHAVKYASDSNLEDALVMLEPGLRRIHKPELVSTSCSSTSEEEESGFFSYQEPARRHVTVITVNQRNEKTCNRVIASPPPRSRQVLRVA